MDWLRERQQLIAILSLKCRTMIHTEGLVLTPNMHRALDHDRIVPGPDFKLHVASRLDSRIAYHRPLPELEGKQ